MKIPTVRLPNGNLANNERQLFRTLESSLHLAAKIKPPKGSLKKPDTDLSPFFCYFLVKQVEEIVANAKNGAIINVSSLPSRECCMGTYIRLGDYKFGAGDYASDQCALTWNNHSLQRTAWDLLNHATYNATTEYYDRRRRDVAFLRREKIPFGFSQEPVAIHAESVTSFPVGKDIERILRDIELTSKRLVHPLIFDSKVSLVFERVTNYFISTEGSVVKNGYARYLLRILGESIAEDGMRIMNSRGFDGVDFAKFPSRQRLYRTADELVNAILETRKSKPVTPGTYPLIMDGQCHGTLWHEGLGHRAEGRSFAKEGEAGIPIENLGKQITSPTVCVIDDPTRPGLPASYSYDDEGVKAQKAVLVENGQFQGYLTSRETATLFNTNSNGHARAEGTTDPEGRMSNTIVYDSQGGYSSHEMLNSLGGLLRRHRKEYGLSFLGSKGGLLWEKEGSSVANVQPIEVFKIYANGKFERTRGVVHVGTPDQMIGQIHMLGDNASMKMSAGYCGADSGYIPNVSIAPSALLKPVQFQRDDSQRYGLPLIPTPS